ncbi:uncharacterized protein [Nicotiana sylvestris]|uniref:Uncharacterized protein LOC104239406 n=1 Tax=Nicotiana sylvestris TaxID=4096 RepID=A0A1U7XN57_NICSY|nr:PREDICTED: uncharacterized protein LOC104239406 [Nicotiana sylvestris]XP_009792338.1 PREDICTED: uncharacterized protein LOC104239406 [Nicotiana sylvestris]
MNSCGYQQTALVGSVGVVCPKPRRLGFFNSSYVHADEPIRGTELLDIILTKGGYDVETTNFELASSPPFFFGSPPTRASNPLIQDAQFSNNNNNFFPILAIPEGAAAPSPPSSFTSTSARVCVPVKYGKKQAAVRIEGFNCCCSISAVA